MKGLDSYPAWVRDGIGVAFLIAAIMAGVAQYPALAFFLGIIGLGLIIPARQPPSA